ncbi:hypothetical protein D3C72_1266400 [compost metagenome]
MVAQVATDRPAAAQQGTDGLLRFGVADPAPDRRDVFAEQDQADEGHLEFLAQAVFDRHHHFFQAAGVEQVEDQPAGLVEQSVVVAGHVHQLRQAVAHLDVAVAQQLELALHQRHAVATLVRDALFDQQLVVLGEEGGVGAQVGDHRFGIELGGLLGYNLGLIGHGGYSLRDEPVLRRRVRPGRSSARACRGRPIRCAGGHRAGRGTPGSPSSPG